MAKARPRVIFLTGPTGSGKTALSVRLARRLGCRIVSCDSMQIYKGMETITSAPSARERAAVPHYLVSQVDPAAVFDVSMYRRKAMAALRDIISAGKTPLFAGGTGLYMSVMVDGIFRDAPGEKGLRAKLERQALRYGPARLHARLMKVDPEAAAKIHPNDARRTVRALEVFLATGKPISQLQRKRSGLWGRFDVRMFCLDMPRAALYARINRRVDAMFRRGLVREVAALLERGPGRTAGAAIGIREVKGYLDGEYGIDECRERMKRATRQYAKRQLTWFRKDKRIEWVDAGSPAKAEKAILKSLRQ